MFKTFDKVDWYGMAGASRFADGSEPLVDYDLRVDGLDAYAVIDGNGFYMAILNPEDGSDIRTMEDADPIAVYRLLASRKEVFTTGELMDMGIIR